MACTTCGGSWRPRGGTVPSELEAYYELALSPVYADTGIQAHLPTIRKYAENVDRIIELGVGGGDQGTAALLAAKPMSLDSYDVSAPGSLPILNVYAQENNVKFTFHLGRTQDSEPVDADLIMVDSYHDAATVDAELAKFMSHVTTYAIFHDVCSFGRAGQGGAPNTGINLAIADYLFRHPEWRVKEFSEADNGLLVLEHE